MLFLPIQRNMVMPGLEKIDTYLTLASLGCPVFASAVVYPNEVIDQEMIHKLKAYFKTEEVTIRYQYIRSSIVPIQGGNRYKLSLDTISPLQNEYTLLWILEPINRLKNDFGINLYFHDDQCNIEIVGAGFDVSDLNRGQVSPHQIITTELPIRAGLYNEWWKFLKYSFATKDEYELSKMKRIHKLSMMGYCVSNTIFHSNYTPLPMEKLEQLLRYISSINGFINTDDFCVSCSINNNNFLFWDIQTPNGKLKTYGVK